MPSLFDPPITVRAPRRQGTAVVFASPHSGRTYPPPFLAASRLARDELRRSEDCYVDELFAAAPAHGAPLLSALFPRSFCDPNREPFELDPEMFEEPLPAFVNTRTERVLQGFGTIARVVTGGAEIYRQRLHFAEAEARIRALHFPYHAALRDLIGRTTARFGRAIVIDCHSMPSRGGPGDSDRGARRADFVLGDRYGRSCAPFLVEEAARTLREMGYGVERNAPYAGGYTVAHYGQPGAGVHALQIEINRALYMDERGLRRGPSFGRLKGEIERLIAALARLGATPT